MRALAAAAAVIALGAAILRVPAGRRVIQLPAGVVDVRSEMPVDAGAEVRGAPAGTVLRLAPGFTGRAAIVVRGDGVRLTGFTIDGNRGALETRSGLPPSDVAFARFTRGNGVLAEGVSGLAIENVRFRNVAGFAILASRDRDISIDRAQITDSGSRNPAGRNNATGGILLEEGTTDFRVTRCDLRRIRGNGVWTHSLYTSPRNARGVFAQNRFAEIGRDALQVGHATAVRVEWNAGRRIGYPAEDVDLEGRAYPVAIDTAGNVDGSSYAHNRFEEIDGKCIDLDGFHDGEVRENACVNRGAPAQYPFGNYGVIMNNSNPDMQSRNIRLVENLVDGPLYGGIFVIGEGHLIARNRLLNINAAHCDACYYLADQPEMLRSGIYLGRGAERPDPARGNTIEDNEITGYKMKARCIGIAPGIQKDWNTIRNNRCE
ncbi:MAG: right-handed parallel beta-helix repeat-containing protein [Acidobacteriia bacterium]|nr:right-handed parallel beta-helix repeat-containing protein [Terriglobia bacterium]